MKEHKKRKAVEYNMLNNITPKQINQPESIYQANVDKDKDSARLYRTE